MPLNIRNYIEQSVYEEVFDEAKKIFTFSSSRSLTQSRDFLFTHCCTKINWWKRSKMIFLAAREAFQIGDKLCKFARRVESIGDKSSRQTRGFFFFLKLTQRLKASRQTSWTSSSPLVAVLLPFQHPSWSFFDFFLFKIYSLIIELISSFNDISEKNLTSINWLVRRFFLSKPF